MQYCKTGEDLLGNVDLNLISSETVGGKNSNINPI